MSIIDFFGGGLKKQIKGHISGLIQLSLSDGVMSNDESSLIKKIATRMGLTLEEYSSLIEDPGPHSIQPPVDLEGKFKRLYHFVQVMMVDGFIDDVELSLVKRYGIGLGFNSEKLQGLIDEIIEFNINKIDIDSAFPKAKNI